MELYNELGVAKDATAEEIDAAYRSRAKRLHPDAGGDEAEFVSLGNAYAVLKSPERRKRYDTTGDTNVPQNNAAASILCTAFAQVLSKNIHKYESTDMVAALRNHLLNEKRVLKKKKTEQAKTNAVVRSVVERITANGREDHLVVMLKGDLAAAEQQLNAFEENITAHEDAIALAKGYVYRIDEPKVYSSVDLTSSLNVTFFPSEAWGKPFTDY